MRTLLSLTFAIVLSVASLCPKTTLADRQRSPVEGQTGLQPDTMPAGPRITPIPELVERNKLEQMARSTPGSALGFQLFAEQIRLLREPATRTPSGLSKLSLYYEDLYGNLQREGVPIDQAKEYFKRYDDWGKEVGYDPAFDVFVAMKRIALLSQAIAFQQREETITPQAIAKIDQIAGDLFEFITKREEQASADPGWYNIAVNTYKFRCQQWPDAWNTLNRGSSKYPHYYQTYFRAYMVGVNCGIDPHKLARDIADLAVERTKVTSGQSLYARTMWFKTQLFGPGIFKDGSVDWPRMRQGMNDVLAEYPDAWNTNHFAFFACIAEDYEMAEKLLDDALKSPINSVWSDGATLMECKSRIEFSQLNKQ